MQAQTIPFTTEEAWLESRKQDVTSTESAALFGLSPYVTHFDLWHRKRTGITPEFVVSDRMKWGNRLEAAIAYGIAEEHGWEVQPFKDYMRLPDLRMGSSFDFIITNHKSGKPVLLEIKNVDYLQFRDGWLVDKEFGDIEAPAHIEMQVQHQLAVSGCDMCIIGAFIGGNRFELVERHRDEEVIAAIKYHVKLFWDSIEAGEEPEPIMPRDAAVIIAMNQYAEPNKILDASSDFELVELLTLYRMAQAEQKNAKEDAEVLKAKIMQKIGDAERVVCGEYKIAATMVMDNPGTEITEDMIGQTIGARRGYRNMRVTVSKK